MARYFITVEDGQTYIDEEGQEFASLAEMRVEAIKLAGAFIKDHAAHADTKWEMTVTNAAGENVLHLLLTIN